MGQVADLSLELLATDLRARAMDLRGYALFHCPFDARRSAYLDLTHSVADGTVKVDVEAVPLRDVKDAWERQARGARRKLVLAPETPARVERESPCPQSHRWTAVLLVGLPPFRSRHLPAMPEVTAPGPTAGLLQVDLDIRVNSCFAVLFGVHCSYFVPAAVLPVVEGELAIAVVERPAAVGVLHRQPLVVARHQAVGRPLHDQRARRPEAALTFSSWPVRAFLIS